MTARLDHTGEIYNNRIVVGPAADTVAKRLQKKRGRQAEVVQRTPNWRVRCLGCGEERTLGWQGLRMKGCGPCTWRTRKYSASRAASARIRSAFRTGAVRRGYEWALDDATVEALIFSACHYCGTKGGNTIRRKDRDGTPTRYNGIDRMDNSRGYVAGNVVPCCGQCNRAKGTLTYEAFTGWVDALVRHRSQLAERAA